MGGNNIVKMAELRTALTAAGLKGVTTYIQSGNIVAHSDLDDAEFGTLVADVIRKTFDVETWPAVIDAAGINAIMQAGAAGGDASCAHAFVFRQPPSQQITPDDLATGLGPTETAIVAEHGVVLYAPDGLARSKFAAKADKILPVPVTARNFRTLSKLRDMVQEAAR